MRQPLRANLQCAAVRNLADAGINDRDHVEGGVAEGVFGDGRLKLAATHRASLT